MKKFLSSLYVALSLLGIVAGFAPRVLAFDPFRPNGAKGPDTSVCSQTDSQGNQSAVCLPKESDNPILGPNGLVNKIANIFALITGIAAVIVIIIGGFEYVRSSGDSSKVNTAKDMILFAIIGLIVVVIARALVALVVSKI